METDLEYQEVTYGAPGGVYNAQYEDFLAMEQTPGGEQRCFQSCIFTQHNAPAPIFSRI